MAGQKPPSYEMSQGYHPGGFNTQFGYGMSTSTSQYGMSPPPPQYGTSAPPTQYGMSPPPPQYGMGVAPIVVQAAAFGRDPVTTFCPSCRANITTTTTSETGSMAMVTAAILCFLGCCCVACVPFCMSSMKDVAHRCPNCNTVVGRYKGRF